MFILINITLETPRNGILKDTTGLFVGEMMGVGRNPSSEDSSATVRQDKQGRPGIFG